MNEEEKEVEEKIINWQFSQIGEVVVTNKGRVFFWKEKAGTKQGRIRSYEWVEMYRYPKFSE